MEHFRLLTRETLDQQFPDGFTVFITLADTTDVVALSADREVFQEAVSWFSAPVEQYTEEQVNWIAQHILLKYEESKVIKP